MENHPEFIDNLLALKNYYQQLSEEYERLAAHAIEQLNHVNALLTDQLSRQHHQQPFPTLSETKTDYDNIAIAPTTDFESNEIPSQPLVESARESATHASIEPDTADLASSASTATEREENSVTQQPLEQPIILEPVKLIGTTANQEPSSQQPAVSPVATDSSPQREHHVSATKTPLLPPYQHLSKSEAVEKLLQDNEGKVLTVDDIIDSLQGEMNAEELKAEKVRMYDTLKKGVKKGLWEKVPGRTGCYTINLKQVQQKTQRSPSRQSKDWENILPQYQHLNFLEAVTAVMQSRVGEVMNSEKVARALYGEIEGSNLTTAKNKVGKNLWEGAKRGRWQRVPGQLGQYTLDLKLISTT